MNPITPSFQSCLNPRLSTINPFKFLFNGVVNNPITSLGVSLFLLRRFYLRVVNNSIVSELNNHNCSCQKSVRLIRMENNGRTCVVSIPIFDHQVFTAILKERLADISADTHADQP
tara:strand:- start:59 stop:406 length:348 start_codon:yes stop_codon:yes gene_type:complete